MGARPKAVIIDPEFIPVPMSTYGAQVQAPRYDYRDEEEDFDCDDCDPTPVDKQFR